MSISIHDGERLRWFIDKKAIKIKDLLKKINLKNYESLYHYFKQEQIKRTTLNKILEAIGVTLEEFYTDVRKGYNKGSTVGNEPSIIEKPHQGSILQATIKDSGISIAEFARKMKVARPTVYDYFIQETLPLGLVLEAAQILNVQAAKIRGIDNGDKSFEKDVYLELVAINKRLDKILQLT